MRQLSRVTTSAQASESLDASIHMAKTILDQGHLAPFAPVHSPRHWNYDHALQLYPPPDVICLGDHTAPAFETCYSHVKMFNPGCFGRDGSFVLFRPNMGTIEMSVAP
mmetsp:Transcript_30781/g.95216  ORF Transcript_30781/g.95216 Transcript_30781/m.95216 type:complete len:108 (-) Transcript_30781:3033-3356(-)